MIATCSPASEGRPPGGKITDQRFADLVAEINDQLEARISLTAIPRPRAFSIRIKDEYSRAETNMSVNRDLDMANIKRRLLRAASDLILETHGKRKRAV